MSTASADVVIAGAGIAGVSTAFHLGRRGVRRVVVCDPLPPLTLTSDKSTECYRNWWPGPGDTMVALMNRSIDILERLSVESQNAFSLNRRGYLYVTADPQRLTALEAEAQAIGALGAGAVRVHDGAGGDPYVRHASDGFENSPPGADVIRDRDLLRRVFPFLTPRAVGAIHARRAGWFSAQQLGAWMIEESKAAGVTFLTGEVVSVDASATGSVTAVLADGRRVRAGAFVNAAGPRLAEVGRRAGTELPVTSELHLKIAFRDRLRTIPRTAPMMIWSDPQHIDWSDEEKELLTEAGRQDVLGRLPPGCHGRPEGGSDSPWVLALWEFERTVIDPVWPLPLDDLYPEVVLRGMTAMVPDLGRYLDRLPQPAVDGGYYTKTIENRPLVGPMEVEGTFVCGALSGFGLMAGCGVGELAAIHVTGGELPHYAGDLTLQRYADPAYVASVAGSGSAGQI